MKILSAEQIRAIDAQTISCENISSAALMYRASAAFFRHFLSRHGAYRLKVNVICGIGNNGGDGITTAQMLHRSGFGVKVFIVEFSSNYTADFRHYYQVAKEENIDIIRITENDPVPDLTDCDIIIDAIFGTGLNRVPQGLSRKVIESVNRSGKQIVSIDVPSGLMTNRKTEIAVHATETVTLQIPKLALFLPENETFTGELSIVHFGLSEKAIAEADTACYFLTQETIKENLMPLRKYAHKGTQGHSLIIGGSKGKIGSVCLASRAALKTGCGLVTAYVPQCGTVPLQTAFPEAMVIEDTQTDHINKITFGIQPDAVGIGPGMGTKQATADAFHRFLQQNKQPLVIDADGLNILSKNKAWLSLLTPQTILTPHPKELSRLIGSWNDDFDKIEKTKNFARRYDAVVVIKGAHSLIVTPDQLFVNSTGTAALATAGTGDVLTGIITGLLAQGYTPLHAALTGVYMHGATADITADNIHPKSFTASDIIENIGNVYFRLEQKNDLTTDYDKKSTL